VAVASSINISITGDNSGAITAINQANSALTNMQQSVRSLGTEFTKLGLIMSGAMTAPIAAVAKLGFDWASMREQGLITFTAMIGGAEEAGRAMNELQGFADKTIFTMGSLIPISQRMLAVGFKWAEIKPILSAVAGAASAMGPAAEEATKRLTKAITDVKTKGFLQGEEIRQFTENGVAAVEIIAKAIGKTNNEVQDMVRKKQMDSVTALNAIINHLNEHYDDVLRAQETTIAGRVSTMQELFSQLSGTLMKPALQGIADFLGILNPAMRELGLIIEGINPQWRVFIVAVLAAVAAIGPLLLALGGAALAFSYLIAPLGAVAVAVGALALVIGALAGAWAADFGNLQKIVADWFSGFTDTLANVAVEAANWGANIVVSLANGMAEAVDAVLSVIAQISSILAYWFAPGSPPRVWPDADKHGAAAMMEFLQGMTKVDLTVFNQLTDLIETELRNAFAGMKDQGGLYDAIMGTRGGVARALDEIRDFGDVTEETMQDIIDAAGPVGDSVRDNIRLFVEWADASRDLADAQNDIKRINAELERQLRPYNKALDDLNDKQEDLAMQERMRRATEAMAKGKDPGGIEYKRALLEMEEIRIKREMRGIKDASKVELDAAKDREFAAKGLVEDLQERIDVQKMLADIQKENIKLYDEFHKKEGGGGGGGGGAAKPVINPGAFDFKGGIFGDSEERAELIEKAMKNLMDKLNPFKGASERITKAWDQMWVDIGESIDQRSPGIIKNFGVFMDGLKDAASRGWAEVQKVFGELVGPEVDNLAKEFGLLRDAWNELKASPEFQMAMRELKQSLKDTVPLIKDFVVAVGKIAVVLGAGAIMTGLVILRGALAGIRWALEGIPAALIQVSGLINVAAGTFKFLGDVIHTVSDGNRFSEWMGGVIESAEKALGVDWPKIHGDLDLLGQDFGRLGTHLGTARDAIVEFFTVTIPTQFENLHTWVVNVEKWLKDLWDYFVTWIQKIIDDVKAKFTEWADTVGTTAQEVIDAIKAPFKDVDFLSMAQGWMDDLVEGIRSRLGVVDMALGWISDRLPKSPAKIGPLSVLPNWEALYEGLDPAGKEAVNNVENTATGIAKAFQNGVDVSGNKATGNTITLTVNLGGVNTTMNFGAVDPGTAGVLKDGVVAAGKDIVEQVVRAINQSLPSQSQPYNAAGA